MVLGFCFTNSLSLLPAQFFNFFLPFYFGCGWCLTFAPIFLKNNFLAKSLKSLLTVVFCKSLLTVFLLVAGAFFFFLSITVLNFLFIVFCARLVICFCFETSFRFFRLRFSNFFLPLLLACGWHWGLASNFYLSILPVKTWNCLLIVAFWMWLVLHFCPDLLCSPLRSRHEKPFIYCKFKDYIKNKIKQNKAKKCKNSNQNLEPKQKKKAKINQK